MIDEVGKIVFIVLNYIIYYASPRRGFGDKTKYVHSIVLQVSRRI